LWPLGLPGIGVLRGQSVRLERPVEDLIFDEK